MKNPMLTFDDDNILLTDLHEEGDGSVEVWPRKIDEDLTSDMLVRELLCLTKLKQIFNPNFKIRGDKTCPLAVRLIARVDKLL